MKPLPPPDDAQEHPEAIELIRGWIVGGDLQVSLAFEVFGDRVEIWKPQRPERCLPRG